MKKVFIAALLVSAGGLFAQELKFDGYFNSGLGVVSTDTIVPDGAGAKPADTAIRAFGVDSESPGWRFRLNGSYTNEAKTLGARFRFQSQRVLNGNNAGMFSLPYAYGWFSFLDNIFTVYGGLVDNTTWQTADFLFNNDGGEGLGALVKISPIKGLDLGIGAYTISQQGPGSNNTLVVPKNGHYTPGIPGGSGASGAATPGGTTSLNLGDLNIGLNRLKYTLNAGYTMPDLFKANLIFRTKNQAGAGSGTGFATNVTEDTTGKEVFAGFQESAMLVMEARLLAVKNLTGILVAQIDKLEDYDTTGVFNLYQTIGYKMGDLGLGLNAAQYFSRAKNAAGEPSDVGLHFNPWVSYTIGNIVPRLDLNYFLAGKALVSPGANQLPGASYHRKVFSLANNYAADDVSVFALRPSVKLNIDPKTFVEIGNLIAIANGPEGSFADVADAKKASNFSNVFYIDFKWSF
jgi:hypothetical protein